jgi:SAM-dependent methyltransferase
LYDDPRFFEGYHRLRASDLERLTLPGRCADLVVSSLALHYVPDYRDLVRRVAGWLGPGGRFVFSIEHPICTATDPMTGWLETGNGTVWPVEDYVAEGPRSQRWIVEGVRKYHRRVSTLIGGLLDAGLELAGIDEPAPGPAAVRNDPHLAEHLRRPPVLLLSARRGDEAS